MRNVAQCCVYVTGEEESALNRYYLTITRLRSENPGPREELAQGLLEILLFFLKQLTGCVAAAQMKKSYVRTALCGANCILRSYQVKWHAEQSFLLTHKRDEKKY